MDEFVIPTQPITRERPTPPHKVDWGALTRRWFVIATASTIAGRMIGLTIIEIVKGLQR